MKKTVRRLLAVLFACIMLATMLAACNKDSGNTTSGGGTENAGSSGGGTSNAGSSSGGGTENAGSSGSGTTNAGSSGGGTTNAGSSGGGGGSGGSSDPGRTLNVAVFSDPGTLHPLSQTGDGGFTDITRCLYDVPCDNLMDGRIEMVLLESYDVISEVHYTLHLREDVVFSNGNPFTAEDFMFSAELVRDHPQYSVNVKTFDFDKTNIVDDHTIDLWLFQYDIGMFPALSWLTIFNKATYNEADLALTPVGTGPYVLSEYVINSHVIVEANPNFWGAEPAIKKIKFHVLNEESQRVNALITDAVDLARIPAKDIEYIESLGGYEVRRSSAAQTTVAYFNVSAGAPLATLEARKAVMHAINRQDIIDMAFEGQTTFPTWPNSDFCVDIEPRFSNSMDVYRIGYDPALARSYAEQSGLTGQSLRIINNGTQLYSTIAQIVQNNLKEIGVESQIINYDQATFFGTLMDASNFDIGLFLMSCPSRFAVEQMTSWPGFISMGWSGPVRDSYIELGMTGMGTSDDAARSEILKQMLDLLDTQHPWYALTENISPRAISTDLGGVEQYSDGFRFKPWYWN